jgi:hypothetical protein
VLLEGRQSQKFVWSVYGGLRENATRLASEPDTHIVMSMIGYEKRAADGTPHSEERVSRTGPRRRPSSCYCSFHSSPLATPRL